MEKIKIVVGAEAKSFMLKCPKCGKGKVKQQITQFMVQTSKKS